MRNLFLIYQRAFSIYTDTRKLQDKVKISYTLSKYLKVFTFSHEVHKVNVFYTVALLKERISSGNDKGYNSKHALFLLHGPSKALITPSLQRISQ